MSKKLTVGQTVYFTGSNLGGEKGTIRETKINKVGNIYFTVEAFHRKRFFVEDLRHDNQGGGCNDGRAYLTKQEILDEKEGVDLYRSIREVFTSYIIPLKVDPLDKLRRIKAIIDEK